MQLHPELRIYPTFHVSQLKRHVGHQPVNATLPPTRPDGMLLKDPSRIVDRCVAKKGLLVEWTNSFHEDATWEVLELSD